MIKTVGMFKLADDTDKDAFWKAHTTAHAREIMDKGGALLRGYVVSRVRTPLDGEPQFWCMVELWFDDEDARAEFDRLTEDAGWGDGDIPLESFIRSFSAVDVEEHVIVRPS